MGFRSSCDFASSAAIVGVPCSIEWQASYWPHDWGHPSVVERSGGNSVAQIAQARALLRINQLQLIAGVQNQRCSRLGAYTNPIDALRRKLGSIRFNRYFG